MADVKVKILPCSCEHKGPGLVENQDKLYGKGNRVHNQAVKGDWRCTVCGKEKKTN